MEVATFILILLYFFFLLLGILAVYLFIRLVSDKPNKSFEKKYKEAIEKNAILSNDIGSLSEELKDISKLKDTLELRIKELVNRTKSSEVRTGLIAEQMAPFLQGFPYTPRKAKFIGNPIDFLVFDEEGVHFVEVKSGGSKLTPAQRKIRDQIKENRVSFEVYRIKGE